MPGMSRRVAAAAAAFAASVVLALGGPAAAKDLFGIDVTVTSGITQPVTRSGSATFNSLTQVVNALENSNLQTIVPSYTPNSAATASLFIRGLPATASYQANRTTLNFTVPSLGINVNFTGATRDESQNEFKNFMLSNGGGILTRMLQALVADTAVDPVAGNPNSLMGTSAAAAFGIGTGIGTSGADPVAGPGGVMSMPNLFTVGGEVGFANAGGYTSTVVTLPLRYAWSFRDPRYALIFDLPVTYIATNGAASYMGSFGTALRIPIIDNWYLTPSVRIGAAGSIDLGAAAVQYQAALGSQYNIYFNDLKLTIGDSFGYIKTGGVSIGTVNVNYDLSNQVTTNGVQVEGSMPFTLFDSPTSWLAYVDDTVFFGSKLYVNHYDEIGINIGTRQRPDGQSWDLLRLGLAFVVGNHFNMVKAQFTYRF